MVTLMDVPRQGVDPRSAEVRSALGRVLTVLVAVALLLCSSGPASALTVSPYYDVDSKDLGFTPSAALEFGERNYDLNVDFGGDHSLEQRGSHQLLMIRNDFSIARRITIGLNLGLGSVDHGRVENEAGTDALSLDGRIGMGGGLRVSALIFENAGGADWFSEFQAFAIASDPERSNLNREDWHLAVGARDDFDWAEVQGGLLVGGSQFNLTGLSQEGNSVNIRASETTRPGLFVNTRIPYSNRIEGVGEVVVTDGITASLGVSYRFGSLDYVPEVARQEVEGSRRVSDDDRGLTSRQYLARAREAIRNENFGQALDWLNEALDDDPDDAETFHQVARIYYLIGESARAVEYMRYAVEREPRNPEYRFQLGRILEEAGRSGEARRQYRATVDLDPSHQKALYRLNTLKDDS